MLNKEELAELDVLLEFKSTCCGVCRKMAPMVDTLIKDNITGKKPYMNNSYYYLKIKYLSNEEFILYSGVTFKIEDENKKRHSLLNTKLFHCYHNTR